MTDEVTTGGTPPDPDLDEAWISAEASTGEMVHIRPEYRAAVEAAVVARERQQWASPHTAKAMFHAAQASETLAWRRNEALVAALRRIKEQAIEAAEFSTCSCDKDEEFCVSAAFESIQIDAERALAGRDAEHRVAPPSDVSHLPERLQQLVRDGRATYRPKDDSDGPLPTIRTAGVAPPQAEEDAPVTTESDRTFYDAAREAVERGEA